MSRLSKLADRLAPEQDDDPLSGYTESQRLAIVQGRRLPGKLRHHRPDGLSPLASGSATMLRRRRGVSHEASRLFAAAQRAGGAVCLQELQWPVTRTADLRQLAVELEHFALVSVEEEGGTGLRARTVVRIAPEYLDVVLVADGWRRWAGQR